MNEHARQMTRIYLYTRFERLWHWFQFLLITLLLVTGLEVHGAFSLLGFEEAVEWHNFIGLTWLFSFAFFVFWLLITEEWKQYIPTTRKILQVIQYYSYGIFTGAPHPVPKRKEAKHNPLQRLTYLMIAAVILPLQMVTGLLYWLYNSWPELGLSGLSLRTLAYIHVAGAFAILIFILIHIYMTTTGHSLFAHIKAMFSGWEDVDDPELIEEWEKKRQC